MHTNAHTPSLAFSEKGIKFRNGWETTPKYILTNNHET